jgi:RNA polymerase-binding transcription factor DksA
VQEIEVEPAEHFADESDRASSIEMINTEEAIKRQMAALEKRPEDFDGKHCHVCGEEISAERLATGAWRDVYCQTIFENRRKVFRG